MSSAKRLAREILDTRRLALGHATSPQLTSSAIDGGQLDITDGDGNRIGGLGLGDDGGFKIDYTGGPKPPKPSPPTVTADAGIFRIEWDGSFVNEGDEGVLATSDTDRVEIHASMDENFVPDRVESFGGAFATLDGGSFTLGPLPEAGTYYFRLVARSKSAQFSEPSDRVEQELAITSIDLEITDAWLTGEAAQTTADGKNSIWRGPDEPEVDPDRPFKDGDIWFEMTDDGKSIPNIWDETAGAWVANDDKRQSDIERVQQELREELDTIVIDGSGTKNFYTPDMPTEGMREGDLWFDSSDKNKPYIYQDGEWVTVRDSFSPPGAGENVFALLDEAGTTEHAIDNQWASVPGFTFTPGASGVEAEVPAGAAAGTATVRLPLTGTFNSAGEWQITAEDTIQSNSLGLGGTGSFRFYSPGADPTARIVLGVDAPGMDMLQIVQPLVIKEDKVGSTRTHSMNLGDQNLQIIGIYPSVYAWSLFLEMTVDSIPGNTISGSGQLAYAVGGKGIVDKAITTEKIAAGAITAESGIIGSINAGTITVGEMDGARIKAQTITADKVLIGHGGELIPDPYFDGQGASWGSSSGSAVFSYSAEAAYNGHEYGVQAKPNTGATGAFYFPFLTGSGADKKIQADPDTTYVVEVWVRRTDGDVSNVTAIDTRVYSHPRPDGGTLKNGVAAGAKLTTPPPPNTWVKLTGTWKAPDATSIFFSPRLTVYTNGAHAATPAKWHVGMVSVKAQAGATLIEGGAISTEHIRAGAITAESGIIGSIDANVITVGKIMGNQLDADAINGKTITGATIRTASSGARVELTQNGLKQYNSLGATIVDMTAGSFTLQGGSITGSTIKTANSGSRVEINTQGLKQYNSSNEVIAEMVGGSMVMRGVLEQTNSIGRLQVGPTFGAGNVSPGISWSNIPGDAYGAGIGVATGTNTVALVVQGPGGGSSASRVNLFKERAYIASYASNNSYLNMANGSAVLRAQDSSGNAIGFFDANTDRTMVSAYKNDLELWGGNGSRFIISSDGTGQQIYSTTIYNRTYTGQSDVCITSYGTIGRRTSARKYKAEEQTVSPDSYADALLSIEHKSWYDREELERSRMLAKYREENPMTPITSDLAEAVDESELTRHVGAIADDFDEAGLSQFVTYGDYGQVEGLQYNLIGVALIPIVRSLRDRIEALEAQLASV